VVSRPASADQRSGRPTKLQEQRRSWIATVGPAGRPHLTGIGALWADDTFYFTSGPRTRKSRNLARTARCVIAVNLDDLDLIVEGTARRVTDEKTLKRLARRYNAQGWPARAERGAFTAEYSAPSAGRPPWYLYALTPSTAFGVATAKPFDATGWRFKKVAKRS
jgi:Pyridoxamine 5'-phosphate oxidase